MLVGIFGGTFDPIHNGHLNLAENLLLKTKIEKILFIPSANPPHKPKQPISPFINRYEMVKLAIEGYNSFLISDIENKSTGLSYTVKTLRKLKKLFPEDQFTLIIGGDSLCMLHSWYKSKELILECSITTYPRPGYDLTLDILKEHWPENIAGKLFSSIIDLPLADISSTNIRKNFYSNSEIKKLLPEKVKQYIIKNKLYY